MPDSKTRKKTLVRFNVQGVKWAMLVDGKYGTPKSYGTATKIALEPDSSVKKIFGDGKAHACRRYIDVNYYYNYDKDDAQYNVVVKRVKDVIKAFVADKHFRLKNAESDIADIDNPYRGINVEFLYLEAVNRG